MNVQDITDVEVYELGLEILLDKLGPAEEASVSWTM